jgi:type IV pilus assembly protein PilO
MKLGFREIIFVSVMLAVLIGAYTFVFKKTSEKREALVTDTESKQKVLNNLNQATAGIEDLNRKTQELEKAITFFQSKLPQEREVDKILQDVWQMAAANSLESKTVKMQKTEKTANYSEQPIQMSLSGDFNGFYSFLLQLEKLPRITRVTQMKLEKISDREGAMQAQLTLSIFFNPASTAVASRN